MNSIKVELSKLILTESEQGSSINLHQKLEDTLDIAGILYEEDYHKYFDRLHKTYKFNTKEDKILADILLVDYKEYIVNE